LGLNSLLAQQGTFSRIYSGGNYDEGIAAFHLPDNTYRLIGNTGSYGWGNTNIWFIALDSAANFMWHKTIGKGGLDKAEDAVMDSKGNIFIVGSSSSQSGASYQMLLVGIDTLGVVFTNEYYGGSDWDFGHGLCLVDDSLLMLVGETYSYGNGQSDAWMLKVNKQGDSLWSDVFGGTQKEAFYGVKYKPNFGFVMAGQSESFGNGSFDAIVYHTNNYGDSIWFASYPDITDGGFYNLLFYADSSVATCGYQMDTNNTYGDNSIMKFDANGGLEWNRTERRFEQSSNYTSLEFQGNNIIATGKTTAYGHGKHDIVVSLLSNSAWYLENFFYGRENDEYSYSLNKDTIGGEYYLIVGTTESYGLTYPSILFLRLDSNLKCDSTPNIDTPSYISNDFLDKVEINVFPNPFSKKLFIDLSLFDDFEKIEVSIIDVYGRVLLRNMIENNNNKYKIITNSIPSGVYYLIIKSKKHSSSKY